MSKKTVADVDVQGKRVLMRADFNVPLEGRRITDDRRIVQALPTTRNILERGGRLVLMSHLGRPKGGPSPECSLQPVAEYLCTVLADVKFGHDCIGPKVIEATHGLKDGGTLLLENLRFHKEEEKNGEEFARQLAELGERLLVLAAAEHDPGFLRHAFLPPAPQARSITATMSPRGATHISTQGLSWYIWYA